MAMQDISQAMTLKLQRAVEDAREYIVDASFDRQRSYIETYILPIMKSAVSEICLSIREQQRHVAGENGGDYFAHYTSISAVVSMLKRSIADGTDFLRLYDPSHFNDPAEGTYLMRQADADLLRRMNNLAIPRSTYIASVVPTRLLAVSDESHMSDSLMFWQLYGRDGEGCSLTLKLLEDLLFQVQYGPYCARKIGRLFQEIVDALNELDCLLSRKGIGRHQAIENIVADTFIGEMGGIQYLYKDEPYAHEKEIRLMLSDFPTDSDSGDGEKFEYREDNGVYKGVRRYYEHKSLKTGEILNQSGTGITLGPCVNDKENLKGYIEGLLRQAGLGQSSVYFSKVNYGQR